MIGGPHSHSWSPTIWARQFGRAPYWTLGIADQHISVMAPTGLSTLHVTEHDKIRFESGAIWVQMVAESLGLASPLPGLSKRAVAEFRAAVASELAEYEASVDLAPALRAASDWWLSFTSAVQEAWHSRRWLTEEFIAEWEARRQRF